MRIAPECLQPGGKIALLTFHSGEDRRVKEAFKSGHEQGLYDYISEVIRPSPEEMRSNSRAIPAKLRWARKNASGSHLGTLDDGDASCVRE